VRTRLYPSAGKGKQQPSREPRVSAGGSVSSGSSGSSGSGAGSAGSAAAIKAVDAAWRDRAAAVGIETEAEAEVDEYAAHGVHTAASEVGDDDSITGDEAEMLAEARARLAARKAKKQDRQLRKRSNLAAARENLLRLQAAKERRAEEQRTGVRYALFEPAPGCRVL
jgi:hypothetical protein